MKQVKRVAFGGLVLGGSLWVWSRNREHTVVFYSPEQFEAFTGQLHSFDVEQARSSQWPQWVSRMRYNWLSDVPLVIETVSQHHSPPENGGKARIEARERTIYKSITRMSREELTLANIDPESGITKWSRDYHDAESFAAFMKSYEAESEARYRADVAKWYPDLVGRIRTRCADDRHVKVRMIYRQRLTPYYLLKLCKLE